MDSLANYGSDDEYEENTSERMGTTDAGSRLPRSPEADANYDEVQMDLSEESNNNTPDRDDHSNYRSRDRRRSSRDDRQSKDESRTADSKLDHYRPYKGHRDNMEDDPQRKDEDRDRLRPNEPKSKYDYKDDRNKDSRGTSSDCYDYKRSPKYREERRSKSRDDKYKRHRRSGSKEKRRSPTRDHRRSSSRDRDRRRSRSPRRTDYRKRCDAKDADRGTSSRYGKRFDRTSNKMAQLEKLGIEIKTPDAEFVTPQMLLQRSMDEQVQKIKNSTGIELPKYYNPAAMNPARYADQIQKRRLLWQKKTPETVTQTETTVSSASGSCTVPGSGQGKVWELTTFPKDNDGKVASKFKRLMGIKDTAPPVVKETGKDILKKQEEMFSSMEQQYEVARTATHTMRGVGLGFGTFSNYPR